MTEREGAVFSAYTGVMMCKDFDVFHKYIEELMERPVFTHEMPELQAKIKEKAEAEFKAIIANQT